VFDATDRRRYEEELLEARRREHDIGLDLQRSMLAGPLPEADALELGVVYRPAVRGLEVGGDWYDAFWLDAAGTLGVVVGDVVGRGIGAATTMGQLRSAVRALASTGLSPGRLLDALDRYAHRHAVGQMATVVYAEVDVRDGRVCYACAGHPPPVVIEPGRAPRMEWEGRSLPLDALPAPERRGEATLDLGADGTLVLYTDGLVESRERPLQTGLDDLLAASQRLGDQPPEALVAALTQELAPLTERTDDVCVLAVRVRAPGAASSAAPG
jgi:serine/threonine-protein kinase RsbW